MVSAGAITKKLLQLRIAGLDQQNPMILLRIVICDFSGRHAWKLSKALHHPFREPGHREALEAWNAFAGDDWQRLPPEQGAVAEWALARLRQAA